LIDDGQDVRDPNLPLMFWYAAEPLAETDPQRALGLALSASSTYPMIRDYMLRRLGASSTEQSIATLVDGLGKANSEALQMSFLDAIRSSLAGQRRVAPPESWERVYEKLQKSSPKVRLQLQSLGVTFGSEPAFAAVRQIVDDSKANAESRVAALASLLGAKDPKLAPVLQRLLKDKELRSAALAGLAQYADPKTASAILTVYPDLSQSDKRVALSTLSSRTPDAIAMLRAIESNLIPSADLSADLVRQLEYLKNEKVNSLVTKTWGTVRETTADKAKLIEETKAVVMSKKDPKPDVMLGRSVYAKTCQQCHILFATGGKIGPELTGSNRGNLDYLLSNIVDPSSVMAKEYQPTILSTQGRTVTGLIKAEDGKSITLQTATTIETIPLDEIDDRKLSEKSMMPEDQLRQFGDHEIRSLIAYLGSDRQIPLLAIPSNSSEFFNGRDLTHWIGDSGLWSLDEGELVGKTAGLAKNEFLVSEFSVRDFHLKMEVKLVGNAGNSGVQFRSQRTEAGIKGYQADIGPDWWGKLYEEEGRGLLWDKSGEAFVKNGDWNRYEIRALGAKIQTWINGELCVNFDDPKGAREGIIALQLHSGEGTEVRFRNMELEVLSTLPVR